jgi:hypothetical protein
MKYLKKFETKDQYDSFLTGSSFVRPNVSAIKSDNDVKYNGIVKILNEITITTIATYAPAVGGSDEIVNLQFIPAYPPTSDLTIAISYEVGGPAGTAVIDAIVTLPAGSEGVVYHKDADLGWPQRLRRIISAECAPTQDSIYKYTLVF